MLRVVEFSSNSFVLGEERFYAIPGASRYMVSDWGRVVILKNNKERKPKFSDTKKKAKAYLKLGLVYDNGRILWVRINRLVYLSSLGKHIDDAKGLHVDHINGNRHDNRLINLQLTSARVNQQLKHLRLLKSKNKIQTEMFFGDIEDKAA